MTDCKLCDIYKSGVGIIFENEIFYSQFDKNPVAPGHSIIVSKNHIVNLLDLNDQAWLSLKAALHETVKIIEQSNFKDVYTTFINNFPQDVSTPYWEAMLRHLGINKKPDGYNFGNNEGEAAGRSIHHLHIHVIPRYIGDVSNPRGGIRHIIPGVGDYKN
jgi:histidine triad (HIT) family protein